MSAVKIVLVLLVLCCVDMLGSADALQQDAEGVCVVKTSSRKTRIKTFAAQIRKMCGRRKCVVKKTKVEVFTVTKNQTVCCNGYGYRSEDDSCTPLCSTGCNGGRCVAPDVCHCDPPATLDEEHKNVCIMPTCEPPCVNGACVANDTCQCNTGFIEYNSTHCYNCDPGYAIDMTFNCVPICDPPCVNGNCIGPNICGCSSGYKLKDAFACEPVCDSPCINSTCTAPNVCSCFEGYTEVNGTCVPRCVSCDNGQCVGPNVCVCNDGFTKADGGCVPTCDETCVNGVCSAPNTCSCNEGYIKDNSSYSRCFKPCSGECKNGCDENGTCIDCSIPIRYDF